MLPVDEINVAGHGENEKESIWVLPGFSPLRLTQALVEQVSADYGAVEQTGLYLDPLGAADWVEVSKQKSYQEARNSFSFAEAGAALAHYFLKQNPTEQLDVFALGCGEASEEVCLVAHLARLMPSIRFFLIDTSQQLLIEGYRHAKQVLSVYDNVEVRGVCGDLFNVSQWMGMVSPNRPMARRLVMLLGGTSLTIQNEVLFARIYHAHVEPNDLLMFDFFKTVAPITSPQEIAAKEPRLSEKSSMGWDHMIHKWHRALVRLIILHIFFLLRGQGFIEESPVFKHQ